MVNSPAREIPLTSFASHRDLTLDRLRSGAWERASDQVAVEEPLELRISHSSGGGRTIAPISITMRTPEHDFDLAAGFLFGEGIVSERRDIETIAYSEDVIAEENQQNTVLVTLRDGLEPNLDGQRRNFAVTSACGVCGKASLAALAMDGCERVNSPVRVSAAALRRMPETLLAAQAGFAVTGGVHASGLFRPNGELIAHAEDVGRHNAFDKLVGAQFLAGTLGEASEMVAILSGRASYELLQKALRARIPIVAAVGAPSSLAVEIAENFGMTLVGFLRPSGFNVYSGRGRICD